MFMELSINKYFEDQNNHNNLKTIIANRLINSRKLANKSQREISKLMDKSPSWVSQIEAGAIMIGLDDLIKLSAIYGTTPGQIMDINPLIATGSMSLDQLIESFYLKISNNLPVEIPVFLHSDYTLTGNPEPIDYIYWTKNRLANRELFLSLIHI